MERAERDGGNIDGGSNDHVDPGDDGDGDVGVETCPNCGSTYEVTLTLSEQRSKDWYNCIVCGRMLMEWDSHEIPRFTLMGSRYLRKPR